MMNLRQLACTAALLGWLAGCTFAPVDPSRALASSPWAVQSGADAKIVSTPTEPAAHWQLYNLPGKQPTEFRYARQDGRDAMAARANASVSAVRYKINVPADQLGALRFSWKVPELISGADMASRDADDSPVRVILAFDGDRSRFSGRNAMLSELMRTVTGEELPYATLMYVWCNFREPGSVITNPRTDRIRKMVVQSGAGGLNQWLDYERNVRADFEKAFGEPPGALVGMAIMTDTDNTRTQTQAWYGPVKLDSAVASRK